MPPHSGSKRKEQTDDPSKGAAIEPHAAPGYEFITGLPTSTSMETGSHSAGCIDAGAEAASTLVRSGRTDAGRRRTPRSRSCCTDGSALEGVEATPGICAASWRASSTRRSSVRRAVHDQGRWLKPREQRTELSSRGVGGGEEVEERFLRHVQVGLDPLLNELLSSRFGNDVWQENARCTLEISLRTASLIAGPSEKDGHKSAPGSPPTRTSLNSCGSATEARTNA